MNNEKKRQKEQKRNILFSPPDISEIETYEAKEAPKSGWITTGYRTKELKRRLVAYAIHPGGMLEFSYRNRGTELQNLWYRRGRQGDI